MIKNTKLYYLAYGSNLNLKDMQKRCPNTKKIGSSILENYRLVYKGYQNNYSYLTIEKQYNSNVFVGVFDLSSSDIESLDYYEGYPHLYKKLYLPFTLNNKEYNGLIYQINNNIGYNLPSKDYIKTCMEGYNDFDFDKNILIDAYNNTKKLIKR